MNIGTDADQRYWQATRSLIARTRDHDRFHLLFSENINYGMRRNLLGLKPVAIAVAGLTGALALALILAASGTFHQRLGRYGPGLAVAILALFFWIVVVTRDWVKVPAEAYAERLIESVELLGQG